MRRLLIGFGNPGRKDDGLGPMLARILERDGIAGLDVDSDYQLTVEDAEAVARYDEVVFADSFLPERKEWKVPRAASPVPSATPADGSRSPEGESGSRHSSQCSLLEAPVSQGP